MDESVLIGGSGIIGNSKFSINKGIKGKWGIIRN